MKIQFIVIEDMFEGTPEQFEDCFGGFGQRDPVDVIVEFATMYDKDLEIRYSENERPRLAFAGGPPFGQACKIRTCDLRAPSAAVYH